MLTEKNSKRLLVLGGSIFIGGVFLFLWKESYSLGAKIDSGKIAQFGDFIGGVIGAIWSLAGVILFYVALTEQRKDIEIDRKTLEAQLTALNQQIKEFELQRVELSETKAVFKEQAETLKVQRFETTLFQLINLHHENIDKLRFNYRWNNPVVFEKREVLFQANIELIKCIENEISPPKPDVFRAEDIIRNEVLNQTEAEVKLSKSYNEFYNEMFSQLFDHYFRNVYHIFKFIYTSKLIEMDNKQFYATIVRAQLSSDELFLILYNCLYKGFPNFLFLVKEFDLLQNFDFSLIEKYPFHKEIFETKINNVVPEFKTN